MGKTSDIRWLGTLIALTACGADTDRAASMLVRTADAVLADCEWGGTTVESGVDTNRNGVLDDVEVLTRNVVCNRPPPTPDPAILIRLVAEPPGAHCAVGGTAVETGPDRNANGVLDGIEVSHTDYACGVPLLTRLAAEPAGARCTAGGVAFLIGRDLDRDGALADAEIEQVELVCGDELTRDVAVHSAADAAALAGITRIDGALVVDDASLTELALPRLVVVHGALAIDRDDQLVRVALPALQTVDGPLQLTLDRALTTLELGQLQRVDSLAIAGVAGLVDLRGLPALGRVIHDVRISDNTGLRSAALPALQLGGELTIDHNPQLAELRWPVGGRLAALRVTGNAGLQAIEVARDASTWLVLDQVTITDNPALGQVALDVDELGELTVEANPGLTALSVGASAITGDATVRDNGPLALSFTAASDFGSVTAIGGALTLVGPIRALHSASFLVVGGDCTLDGTQLTALDRAGALRQVGGTLRVIDNPQLVAMAPLTLGGGLELRGNPALTTLDFVAQDELFGGLTVIDNAALAAAPSLEALARVRGDVRIAGDPALKAAFTATLTWVDGELALDANPSLGVVGLTGLRHVGALSITGCASIRELDLAALVEVATRIDVAGNPALGDLQAPRLRSADLGVIDNPQLPACEVDALFAGLRGDHHQAGNDATAVCGGPPPGLAREAAR